jgi:CDP-4-dehydro-6-deoxyglucose reductase
VQEIVLHVEPTFDFAAGQYLEILLPQGARIPLSIASGPHRLPEVHLHYRSTPGVAEAALFDELLETSESLDVAGPHGDVRLELPLAGPILIAAGGTGASQALGLIDALVEAPPSHEVSFVWCADSEADFYRRDWLASLHADWLSTTLIVDGRRDRDNRGLAWLRARSAQFRNRRIFLCGGPPFVYAAADELEAGGVPRGQLAADAFSYAPRPDPSG